MKNKILVIGGTGTVGSQVIEQLKQGNADYVALARTQEKAKVLEARRIPAIIGTLDDMSTIQVVMEGIDTLFLLTNPAANMLDLHKGAIDMAAKTGVKKVVRLSGEPANYSEGLFMYEQHSAADEYLKQSGLEYVILRPHTFIQSLMFMHAHYIKTQNSIAQYLGDAKIPMIDVRDIAKVAFIALTKDDYNGRTFTLTGPKAIGFSDIAETLSQTLGRTIHYHSLSYEEQEAGFKSFGLPDWQVESVMKVFKVWVDRGVSNPTNDFETITNSKATSIEEFVEDHVQIFK